MVGSDAELFVLFAVASPPPETETLLVMLFVPTAVPIPTFTLKLNTEVLLPATFEIAVVLVQVITWGVAAFELQVQFAAFAPLNVTAPAAPPLTVRPEGRVSETVIVPLDETVPALVTVNE